MLIIVIITLLILLAWPIRTGVDFGTPRLVDLPEFPPRPLQSGAPRPQKAKRVTPKPSDSGHRIFGIGSWYPGSRGFHGLPHVAVPSGRWTGKIGGWVWICVGTRTCVQPPIRLPVVDFCQCYVHTSRARIVDLSIEAVRKLGLDPARGVWPVIEVLR